MFAKEKNNLWFLSFRFALQVGGQNGGVSSMALQLLADVSEVVVTVEQL